MLRGLRRPFWLYAGVCVLILLVHMVGDALGWFGHCVSMSIVKWTYLWGFLFAPILFLGWYGWTRWRGKKIGWLLPVGSVVLLGNYMYATHVEPYRLKVREVTLVSDKIDRPLTILHITDIQSDEIDAYEVAVFDKMIELRPDLVIHTGDLIQTDNYHNAYYTQQLEALAAQFRRLDPPLGVYNVPGDTDPYLDFAWFDSLAGLTTLENDMRLVDLPNGGTVSLLGLSLEGSRRQESRLVDLWLGTTAPGHFSILFGHAPDFALDIGPGGPDLALAGHTHGGQVRLPYLGALMTMSEIPRDWARGWRQLEATWLNVSAGIGTEHAHGIPPLRWNCPPEMTVIRLLPAK